MGFTATVVIFARRYAGFHGLQLFSLILHLEKTFRDMTNFQTPTSRETLRSIMRIAVPAIVSNISVPLLSLVDTAITGHLGSRVYLGAIAVGGMIFNVLYWLMGFLRMGTSGLTAQAFGRKDSRDMALQFSRALFLALGIGLLFVALSPWLCRAAFAFVDCPADVEAPAVTYFRICILGAPAVLGIYAFSGWFLGMQNSVAPMCVAIVQNVANLVASLLFVYALQWKVEGVAAGTVAGEYVGFALCFVIFRAKYHAALPGVELTEIMNRAAFQWLSVYCGFCTVCPRRYSDVQGECYLLLGGYGEFNLTVERIIGFFGQNYLLRFFSHEGCGLAGAEKHGGKSVVVGGEYEMLCVIRQTETVVVLTAAAAKGIHGKKRSGVLNTRAVVFFITDNHVGAGEIAQSLIVFAESGRETVERHVLAVFRPIRVAGCQHKDFVGCHLFGESASLGALTRIYVSHSRVLVCGKHSARHLPEYTPYELLVVVCGAEQTAVFFEHEVFGGFPDALRNVHIVPVGEVLRLGPVGGAAVEFVGKLEQFAVACAVVKPKHAPQIVSAT